MQKKIIFVIAILALLGIVGFFYTQKKVKQEDIDPIFAAFKSNCEVYDRSPYQDPTVDLRIVFEDDQLICLSRNAIDRTYEMYIWQKSAFEAKKFEGSLERVILGKIAINPPEGLPRPRVVDQFSTMVDGEAIEGDVIVSSSCIDAEKCPRAKRIIFEHFGKTFHVEEYSDALSLFERIQFGK